MESAAPQTPGPGAAPPYERQSHTAQRTVASMAEGSRAPRPARPLPREVVAAIDTAVEINDGVLESSYIHSLAKIYKTSPQAIVYNMKRWNKVKAGCDDRKKGGRRPVIDKERAADFIRGIIEEGHANREWVKGNDIAQKVSVEFGMEVSTTWITRVMERYNIPRKRPKEPEVPKPPKVPKAPKEPKAPKIPKEPKAPKPPKVMKVKKIKPPKHQKGQIFWNTPYNISSNPPQNIRSPYSVSFEPQGPNSSSSNPPYNLPLPPKEPNAATSTNPPYNFPLPRKAPNTSLTSTSDTQPQDPKETSADDPSTSPPDSQSNAQEERSDSTSSSSSHHEPTGSTPKYPPHNSLPPPKESGAVVFTTAQNDLPKPSGELNGSTSTNPPHRIPGPPINSSAPAPRVIGPPTQNVRQYPVFPHGTPQPRVAGQGVPPAHYIRTFTAPASSHYPPQPQHSPASHYPQHPPHSTVRNPNVLAFGTFGTPKPVQATPPATPTGALYFGPNKPGVPTPPTGPPPMPAQPQSATHQQITFIASNQRGPNSIAVPTYEYNSMPRITGPSATPTHHDTKLARHMNALTKQLELERERGFQA